MASDSKTDILMMFETKPNTPVSAECTLNLNPDVDAFLKGFGTNSDLDSYANFFEVSDFSFSFALQENNDKDKADEDRSNLSKQTSRPGQNGKKAIDVPWSTWRTASVTKPIEQIVSNYGVQFNDFQFSRTIDAASPIFFQASCLSQEFHRAVLVKRASIGDPATASLLTLSKGGAPVSSMGFLRIQFLRVLITSINWDDGDLVKETCRFICRGMEVDFKPQKWDGTMDDSAKGNVQWRDPNNPDKLIKFEPN